MTNTKCNHDSKTSAFDADGIAFAWDCDDCGHLTPFDDWDYAFHAEPWMPPRPESIMVSDLGWALRSDEERFAHYAR